MLKTPINGLKYLIHTYFASSGLM